MRPLRMLGALLAGFALLCLRTLPTAADSGPPPSDETYSPDEVIQAGADFFGITTEVMAKAVQRVFEDLGQPDAYIKGSEGSGAVVVGLRYGSGWLMRKD